MTEQFKPYPFKFKMKPNNKKTIGKIRVEAFLYRLEKLFGDFEKILHQLRDNKLLVFENKSFSNFI